MERSIRWQHLLPEGDVDSNIVHCFLQIEEYKLRIQWGGRVGLTLVPHSKLVAEKLHLTN